MPMITTHKTGVDKEGSVWPERPPVIWMAGLIPVPAPSQRAFLFFQWNRPIEWEAFDTMGIECIREQTHPGHDPDARPGFACGLDTQLDIIAEHLGIDPVAIRLKNSRQPGDYTSTKSFVASCAMDETIRKAERSGWKEKWGKLPPFHGIGIGTNSVQTGFPMESRRISSVYQI